MSPLERCSDHRLVSSEHALDHIGLNRFIIGAHRLDEANTLIVHRACHVDVANQRIMVTMTGNMLATGASAALALTGGVDTVAGATSMLAKIDAALSTLNGYRSKLGSVQNRLERSISNIEADIENATAANSRIRDVDFASETANFTRSQILIQSGTAILAQANSSPQAALSLLG